MKARRSVGSMPTVMNTELAHLVRSEGYSSEDVAEMGIAKKIDFVADQIALVVAAMLFVPYAK